MVGRQKCSCSWGRLVPVSTKFQSGFSSLFSKLASLFYQIALKTFSATRKQDSCVEVQWCAPILCGLEISPFLVMVEKFERKTPFVWGSLYLLEDIFLLPFLFWMRAKKYSDVSEHMFCSFLLFFLVHVSVLYYFCFWCAKVGIFFTIIIIIRYLPEFLSIIAAFCICSSNWWLFLRLLKIINISNTSQ